MNALNKLEKTKVNLCKLIEEYFNNGPFTEFYVAKIEDETFYDESRKVIRSLARKRNIKVPDFLQASRTLDEAVYYLTTSMDINDNEYTIKQYIRTCFNEYLDYMEDEQIDVQIVHVECEIPEDLTFKHIVESIQKCENRINNEDYSGAVTSAKTLVEGVCKEILQKFPDVKVDNKTDLPALFTKVRQNLKLDPSDPDLDKSLKDVITGLIKIVNGISEVRNSRGDSHLPKNRIDRHHAVVVVNSAKTVVTFLFNTYEYQLNKGTLT
ncbi:MULTISPECIES: abortive infection family protein [unclassified Bacillus (in: firmicutes)]|uniref:abortive infection family protein n=1 Tax=unclassified Bacillus (in: firmicutes) TaxID=185979 RepID=UPI0015969E3A|nr:MULTISPECIES: abortive infection family protein [unclassified Bacillus (in: firmicutes)]